MIRAMRGRCRFSAPLILSAFCCTYALKVEFDATHFEELLGRYGAVSNSSEASALDDSLLRKQKCKGAPPRPSSKKEKEAFTIIDRIMAIVKRNQNGLGEGSKGGGKKEDDGGGGTDGLGCDGCGVPEKDLDKLESLGQELSHILGDSIFLPDFFRTTLWYFTQDGRRHLKEVVEVGKKVGARSRGQWDALQGQKDLAQGDEEDQGDVKAHHFFMEFMRGYARGKSDAHGNRAFSPERRPINGLDDKPSASAILDYKLGYIVGFHVGGDVGASFTDTDRQSILAPGVSLTKTLPTRNGLRFKKMIPTTVAVVAMMGTEGYPVAKHDYTLPLKLGDLFGRKLLVDLINLKRDPPPAYDYFFAGLSLPLIRMNGILDSVIPDHPESGFYMMGYRLSLGCSNIWPNSPDGDTTKNHVQDDAKEDMGQNGDLKNLTTHHKGHFNVHHDDTHTGYAYQSKTSYHRADYSDPPEVDYIHNKNKKVVKEYYEEGHKKFEERPSGKIIPTRDRN